MAELYNFAPTLTTGAMKIAHTIFGSFLFILLLFAFTTWINFRQSEAVKDNAEFLTRSTTIVRNATRMQRNLLNIQSGLRGYLLTGEMSFIQAFDSAGLDNQGLLSEMYRLVTLGTAQHRTLESVDSMYSAWLSRMSGPLREAKANAASDSSLAAFNRLYRADLLREEETSLSHRLQEGLRSFTAEEYRIRDERKALLAASVQKTRTLSVVVTSFTAVLGLAVAAFLALRISGRMRRMVDMANAIAAGTYNVQMQEPGRDEIGELGRSLNHMAGTLSEHITLLRRRNTELDQFAHVVSHDMKGPLRGIGNVVSWIEEDHGDELSPKVKEYLGVIRGRVKRGENLIEGILSYARAARQRPEPEEVDVALLVAEAAESVALRPGLRLDILPGLPVIKTARVPMLQVFSNLIGNAAKYHHQADGTIRVSGRPLPRGWEFWVEDDGPGIAAQYHDKIFQIFQTLQERDSFESNGVGLAIVKKILDDRGETIRLRSEPGQGATFLFTWTSEVYESNTDSAAGRRQARRGGHPAHT